MGMRSMGVAGVLVAVIHPVFWSADPPPGCAGGEPYRLEVQVSFDNGYTWTSGSKLVYGYPGQTIYMKVRTLMTVTAGQTQGWSFSLKHDPSSLRYNGGDLVLSAVTTEGTHTATVKGGGPPDFNQTEARGGFNGFTQGVMIDNSQEVTLSPTYNFVTAGACYRITFPPYGMGYYQATLKFTSDIGTPPVEAVIVQDCQEAFLCAKNFTLYLYRGSYGPPGSCTLGNWLGGRVGESLPPSDRPVGPGPLFPEGLPTPPFSCADADGNDKLNLTDPILVLSYLFQGGSPPAPVPQMTLRTGQVQCFESDPSGADVGQVLSESCPPPLQLAGQDGQYQAGLDRQYEEAGNAQQGWTIRDLSTGLMWQKTPDTALRDWAAADAYARGLGTGGFPGWRLPTVGEALSICDLSRASPALPSDFDPWPPELLEVWTSTPYGSTGTVVWSVDVRKGEVLAHGKGGALHVFAVRSDKALPANHDPTNVALGTPEFLLGDSNNDGNLDISDAILTLNFLFKSGPSPCIVTRVLPETYGPERFIDNGDDTITDRFTGLMWTKAPVTAGPPGQEQWWDWKYALNYCEGLILPRLPDPDFKTDWRLPNVFELASLLNFRTADPDMESFLPDVFDLPLPPDGARPLWTSTTSMASVSMEGDPPEERYWWAWTVNYRPVLGEPNGGFVKSDNLGKQRDYGYKDPSLLSSAWILAVRGPDPWPRP